MSDNRIPYDELTFEQQEAIHAWVRRAGINPERVPAEAASIVRDGDHWLIDVYRLGARGQVYLDPATGKAARDVVRVPDLGELPWPTKAEAAQPL